MTSKLPLIEQLRAVLREELATPRGAWLVDAGAERSVLASAFAGLAVDVDPNDYESTPVRCALRVMSVHGLPVGQVYEREHLVALAVRIHPSEGLAGDTLKQAHVLRELEGVVFHAPVCAGKYLVQLTTRLRQLAVHRRVFGAIAIIEAGLHVAVEQGLPVDTGAVRDQLLAAVAPLRGVAT